jgi:hypothetical protein
MKKHFLVVKKTAHVLHVPLFKKEDSSLSSNYRPVSLLSCVSKIMERRILKKFIITFKVITCFINTKLVFLPGHSTVYQLIETYHNIVKKIDEGKSWCMFFCNLSKAFDAVSHSGLLFKLKTFYYFFIRLCGKLLQWFESYMCDRIQKVMYKDLLSSDLTINAGMP